MQNSSYETASSPTPQEEEEADLDVNISDEDWSRIRPYIDEHELAALDPRARIHIIYSALACNLDKPNSTDDKASNYSGTFNLYGTGT